MRHGARHEPYVARNEYGTPILADVFARADAIAQNPVIGFVNADIILLADFLSSIRATMRFRNRFLIVSSRFNCSIDKPLSFDAGWDVSLRARARKENRVYPAGGSDVFVYRRGLFQEVPPFAIGRGYWDNWLMGQASHLDANLIDATYALTAIHQEHSYEHVTSIAADTDDTAVYETVEGLGNLSMAGGHGRLHTVFDAAEVLTADGRLLSTWSLPFIHRHFKATLRRAVRRLVYGNGRSSSRDTCAA